MAKIFKISGYFVDLNGNFDASGLAVSLRQSFDLIDHHIEVEEVTLPGEWDDDHPLNQCDCPVSECEKYFAKTEPVEDTENRVIGSLSFPNIKVGDKVQVVNCGEHYSGYKSWVLDHVTDLDDQRKWKLDGRRWVEGDIGLVKYIAPHENNRDMLAYVDFGHQCSIIGLRGLERVEEG